MGLTFNHIYVIDAAMIYKWCLWTISDIYISSIKDLDYQCIISRISESGAINVM